MAFQTPAIQPVPDLNPTGAQQIKGMIQVEIGQRQDFFRVGGESIRRRTVKESSEGGGGLRKISTIGCTEKIQLADDIRLPLAVNQAQALLQDYSGRLGKNRL